MAIKGDITGLEVLEYGGAPLVPLNNGYSRGPKSGVIQSDISGGLTKQNKRYYNQPYVVQASFYLGSPALVDFLNVFVNRNEGKKFICHLAADYAYVEPHVVQVISDWQQSDVDYFSSTVTLTLEVVSGRIACYDNFIYDFNKCVGDETGCVLQSLETLVRAF